MMTKPATRATSVHVRIEGAGAPLALVHELGGSLESFEFLAPRLAAEHRVLSHDQSGCGKSAPAQPPVTLDSEAALLLDLMAETFGGEPCRLVGVAAGAAIAVIAALERPEAVAALALCAPALDVPARRRAYLEARAAQAAAEGMEAIVEPSLQRSYPPALRRRDEAAFMRYRQRFLATDPASYAAANIALAGARLAERLREIDCPCLFLAGRHDELRPPADVERLARSVPGACFAAVESGHIMPMQAPAEMAGQLLAFFGSLSPSEQGERSHG